MIRYYKYQNHSNIEKAKNKWFLRVKNGEQIDLDALAAHMAAHNTPYSKGSIKGVLTDMVNCVKELLLDGKTVKIGDLAIFSLGIHCVGANEPEEATVANIRGFSFNARGTGQLAPRKLVNEVKFKELDAYSL